MKIKELKEILNQCDENLEIQMLIFSHEHLYSSTNEEIGNIDVKQMIPLKSISIKNNDGYGYVLLSNLDD